MTHRSIAKLLVSTLASAALAFSAYAAGPKGDSIAAVATVENAAGGDYEGVFDTLLAAIEAADPAIFDAITGNGQLTVFAPTDDAFADLGLTAANIGELPTEDLTTILLNHVVKGRRDAEDVTSSTQLRTLLGVFLLQDSGTLTIPGDDPNSTDDDTIANIIVPDVYAANGIIHAIDAVLLPPAE